MNIDKLYSLLLLTICFWIAGMAKLIKECLRSEWEHSTLWALGLIILLDAVALGAIISLILQGSPVAP